MLYQGIIGGGSSPVEPVDLSPVLLWTNPSPTSEFAPQKIDLDLTNYVGVIVEYKYTYNVDFMCTRTFVKKDDIMTYSIDGNAVEYGSGCGYLVSGSSWSGRARSITSIDNTGITFGKAGYANTVDNGHLIPTKIYGVQEYVVESNISVGTITSGKTVNCNIGDLIVIFVTDTKEFSTLVNSGAESLQMSSNISSIGNYGYMEIVKATSEVVTLNSNYSHYSVISI